MTRTPDEWKNVYEHASDITDVPWETKEATGRIKEVMQKVPGGEVIDVGCGFGTHSIYLAEQGFRVSACDIATEAIKTAEARAKEKGLDIDFFVADITSLDTEKRYDCVFDRGCLHSLDENGRNRYLQTINKILKPKGWLYLEVFAKNPEFDSPEGPHQFSEAEITGFIKNDFEIIEFGKTTHTISPDDSRTLYSILARKRE